MFKNKEAIKTEKSFKTTLNIRKQLLLVISNSCN